MKVRPLTRAELDIVIDWAAAEGGNPGNDADAFWSTDPDGFLGVDQNGELVGAGAIVDYGGRMGYMGLFIVRPDHRGHGLGRQLWFQRRNTLLERLDPGAPIALDGVKDMEPFYAGGGFRASHDQIRMRLRNGQGPAPSHVHRIREPLPSLTQFDARCFGVPRTEFLRPWLAQSDHICLASVTDRLHGYGVLRPCRTGYKVGPLFAETTEVAQDLFAGLTAGVPEGSEIFIDVPEVNEPAMQWVVERGGQEVFRCARMYYGPPPATDWAAVFGVTTLELG